MSNWKLINSTFLYDGTWDGFLSIVFNCYASKTLPQKIFSENDYLPNFLDKTIFIETDFEKSKRVFNGIENLIGYDALRNSYYGFLSDEPEKEINLLKYICDGFSIGSKINNKITISYVFKVINMRKKTFNEYDKLRGLLRFQEVGTNLFYASIHPTHNILELLGHHFIRRLPTQNFIIHDKVRNICLLYNTQGYKIIDSSNIHIPNISYEEQKYQSLWKMFFKTIAIAERKNLRCQMNFMPKKYWQDLIENP